MFEDLLEALKESMGYENLSDLHGCSANRLYMEVLPLLADQRFGLEEWSYSLSYIFDQFYYFNSKDEIVETLKQRLAEKK